MFADEKKAVRETAESVEKTLEIAQKKLAEADVAGANIAIGECKAALKALQPLLESGTEVLKDLDTILEAVPTQFREAVAALLKLVGSPANAADRMIQRASNALQAWDDGITVDLTGVKWGGTPVEGRLTIGPLKEVKK
jgi:hypothetical protein